MVLLGVAWVGRVACWPGFDRRQWLAAGLGGGWLGAHQVFANHLSSGFHSNGLIDCFNSSPLKEPHHDHHLQKNRHAHIGQITIGPPTHQRLGRRHKVSCIGKHTKQLPQSALGSRSPLQAMKDWYKIKPVLFKKQPYYLPGCDSYI